LPDSFALPLFDSHCHLDDPRFDADRDVVVERARAAGVVRFVVAGTTRQCWPRLRDTVMGIDGAYAAYGLHPWFMREHQPGDAEALDAWLDANPAVALGECGLDFYNSRDGEAEQFELFRSQLDIAANHGLPVILHVRKAMDETLRELRRSTVRSGVAHSFAGSLQQAQQLADMGFKLGIAATVGYERARKLREVVAAIDLNALVIETDAPDQPGPEHRGARNEPGFLIDHLAVMAELRGMQVDELSRHLTRNTEALFGL
jgi:TatD DNase family protein